MAQMAIEDEIYAIWREVLGTPGLGLDENFFEAGGTSILATRLAARLCRLRVSKPVTAQDVFLFPTVRALTEEFCQSETAGPLSAMNLRASRQRHTFGRLRFSQSSSSRGGRA